MEAQLLRPRTPAAFVRPLEPCPALPGRWGLVAALAALPVLRAPRPLHGYQAGLQAGHPIIRHDLTQLGFNLIEGLSNGAIWALIAMGYTLVYGIIELINFAPVATMGSFRCGVLGGDRSRHLDRDDPADRGPAADARRRDGIVGLSEREPVQNIDSDGIVSSLAEVAALLLRARRGGN